ncbi:MAG: PKD domain-containing protein [Methanomicrobiales archaeon]
MSANNLVTANVSAVPQGSYIHVNPVGTRQSGEKIIITATTDLQVGSPVLFDVLPSAVSPTRKSPAGASSGATGTVSVYSGQDRKQNLLGFEVDLSAFQPGDYHVLASSANNDITGTEEFTVVSATNKKPPVPVFTRSPQPAIVGQPVAFDGSGSTDPDGKIIIWQWDFGDGTPLTSPTGSPNDAHATHTYRSGGNYKAGLKVIDNSEQVMWAYNEVSVVVPVPPVADFLVSPLSGQAYENHPFAVTLSDTSTGSPLTWAWYVDNNLVSQLRTYSQSIFTKPGNYTIRLVVTNDYGTSAKEKQVKVLPFETTTITVTRTPASPTRTATGTLEQTPVTVAPVPTTLVPLCPDCDNPCVLFSLPCLWIDILIVLIIVIFVILYIRNLRLSRQHPMRKQKETPDSTKPPGLTEEKGSPIPDVTIIARGGISPGGLEVTIPDIHMDVESGIHHLDKEE